LGRKTASRSERALLYLAEQRRLYKIGGNV